MSYDVIAFFVSVDCFKSLHLWFVCKTWQNENEKSITGNARDPRSVPEVSKLPKLMLRSAKVTLMNSFLCDKSSPETSFKVHSSCAQ